MYDVPPRSCWPPSPTREGLGHCNRSVLHRRLLYVTSSLVQKSHVLIKDSYFFITLEGVWNYRFLAV